MNDETSKLKADKPVFTIADGLVQHLLVNHLFRDKFKGVVGEEDETNVNITIKPWVLYFCMHAWNMQAYATDVLRMSYDMSTYYIYH